MNKEKIENIIFYSLKQIAPDTEPSELLPNDNIRETLGIDSFDFLQFIVMLDEKLNIEIPEKDYGKITNLDSLSNYLLRKTEKSNSNE
jgi:acyl carrier protein